MQKELSRSNMKRNWFTISSLVSKDFKLKYRRSVLGVLWSVLNPLLMMLVMTFVFSSIFRFSVENYPLYVVLGNVLFALMSDSTTTAMYSIIDSSSLIKKIRIEKLIFPIEKVLFQLVNFCISLRSGDCNGRYARCSETQPLCVAVAPAIRGLVQCWRWHGSFGYGGIFPRRVPPLERRHNCVDLCDSSVLPCRDFA